MEREEIQAHLECIRSLMYLRSPEESAFARWALKKLPPEETSELLLSWRTTERAANGFVLEAALLIDSTANFRHFADELISGDRTRRWFICNILAESPTVAAESSLIAVAKFDVDSEVRIEAFTALRNLGSRRAIGTLHELAKDDKSVDEEGTPMAHWISNLLASTT